MELLSTHPIKKSDLGFNGNLFGGKLLSWIDSIVVAYAMEKCRTQNMITIAIDKCIFKKPAREGQMLKIYGEVAEIGNTSITLTLEARAHSVYTGQQSVVLSTNIKFVRIDEDGNSIPLADRIREKVEKGWRTK